MRGAGGAGPAGAAGGSRPPVPVASQGPAEVGTCHCEAQVGETRPVGRASRAPKALSGIVGFGGAEPGKRAGFCRVMGPSRPGDAAEIGRLIWASDGWFTLQRQLPLPGNLNIESSLTRLSGLV